MSVLVTRPEAKLPRPRHLKARGRVSPPRHRLIEQVEEAKDSPTRNIIIPQQFSDNLEVKQIVLTALPGAGSKATKKGVPTSPRTESQSQLQKV